jgi:hypothetical protein
VRDSFGEVEPSLWVLALCFGIDEQTILVFLCYMYHHVDVLAVDDLWLACAIHETWGAESSYQVFIVLPNMPFHHPGDLFYMLMAFILFLGEVACEALEVVVACCCCPSRKACCWGSLWWV